MSAEQLNNILQLTPFSLKSFDEKIINRFDKTISVRERNQDVLIPALISTPERWAMLEKYNAIIDQNKNPILPLIIIKRSSVETVMDNSFVGRDKLITYKREIDYDKSMNSTNPIYNIYQSLPPVYTTINYDIKILTRYMTSLNAIIEQFILKHQKFNMDNLRAEIGSFSEDGNISDFNEDIRIISAGTSLIVTGHVMNNDKVDIKKVSSTNKIILTERVV